MRAIDSPLKITLRKMILRQETQHYSIFFIHPVLYRIFIPFSYGLFDMDDLKALPISEILSEDGLLIIWLTNNKAVHENLTRILEHWDLKEITKWHWLKVLIG